MASDGINWKREASAQRKRAEMLIAAAKPFVRGGWFVSDSDSKQQQVTVTVGQLRALLAAMNSEEVR